MSLNTINTGSMSKSIENVNQVQSQPIESIASQDSHRSIINKNINIDKELKQVNDDN